VQVQLASTPRKNRSRVAEAGSRGHHSGSDEDENFDWRRQGGAVYSARWSSAHVAFERASEAHYLSFIIRGRVEQHCDNAQRRRATQLFAWKNRSEIMHHSFPLVHVSDRLRYQQPGTLNNACGGPFSGAIKCKPPLAWKLSQKSSPLGEEGSERLTQKESMEERPS